MKVLNAVAGMFSRRQKRAFQELPSALLAAIGILSILIAGYWGLMLSEIVPPFVKKVNEVGISFSAVSLGALLGIYGLALWYFGCIAARCHSLLYERWFK